MTERETERVGPGPVQLPSHPLPPSIPIDRRVPLPTTNGTKTTSTPSHRIPFP